MPKLDILWPLLLSLAVTAVAGLILLPILRRLKFGQSIREDGPRWHSGKQGTPTMGGFMFMTGITLTVIVLGWRPMLSGEYNHLVVLLFSWVYGFIGFIDDYVKVVKKRNLGLTALQKYILQLAAASTLILLLRSMNLISSHVYIPFFGTFLELPWLLFLPITLVFVTGFVNAVNLTDGVDGLCAGVTLPIALFFGLYAYQAGQPTLGILGGALCGGMIGFLLFNFHPAKVFMGDTGALFIGGALCGLALAVGKPLLLVSTGLLFIVETLSVVIQVLYFKCSGGKRIFRMAPIHHHLEMGGWQEKKLVGVFFILSSLFCLITWWWA